MRPDAGHYTAKSTMEEGLKNGVFIAAVFCSQNYLLTILVFFEYCHVVLGCSNNILLMNHVPDADSPGFDNVKVCCPKHPGLGTNVWVFRDLIF